jgi:glycosyltransferase involved in cell wall biosynthesis
MVADGGALVIPVGDAGALRSAIERLAADHELRRRLGKEAQRTVCARYSPSSALTPLAEAYRTCSGNPNSVARERRIR